MTDFPNNPQDFMAGMLNLQQQYLQQVGQMFNNPGATPQPGANPFENWWQQFPKTGQAEFDDFFRNLSRAGLDAMQQPFARMQQPFAGGTGGDWFNQMNEQFQSWIKASSPSRNVFEQINEQFRQQMLNPFGMAMIPGLDNPFAGFNPADQLNSSVIRLLQNLFDSREKPAGEQLLATLQQYQHRLMEMNSLIAQVGIDSLQELQQRLAEQENMTLQALYENWMEVSRNLFDQQKLGEPYQQLLAQLTEAGEKLREDLAAYQAVLIDQLGLVSRDDYHALQQQVAELQQQVRELAARSVEKAAKPGATADDFTVINGIGAKFNEKLHEQGIKTMQQLASLSDDMLQNLDESLQSNGRLFQQQWREQAEKFVDGMTGNK